MKFIDGGVCAAKGFRANGIHCGIRRNKGKKDLAIIVSDVLASAAAVYTTNLVKGAPLIVTKRHLADGTAQAVICNSGNANTCNANGIEIAEAMCALVEAHSGIAAEDVVVASTGVIGQPLSIDPITKGMDELFKGLALENSTAANHAIMTTDTREKQVAVEFDVGGSTCRIGGIAKGSGMINPNMATMLVFVTSDVAITPEMLDKAIKLDVADSFNMVTVDGDTSTNDMMTVLSNGRAKNKIIEAEGADFTAFCAALAAVTRSLCRMIAKDGEGATKLIEVDVSGAKNKESARIIAKSVVGSSLLKAAMFGADANWGRVLCAIGYSGADTDISAVDVDFRSAKGQIAVCRAGSGVAFDESVAKMILSEDEITVLIGLADGADRATAWGCDLTYDYVRINGDYRT